MALGGKGAERYVLPRFKRGKYGMRFAIIASGLMLGLGLSGCGSDTSGDIENEDGDTIGTYEVDAGTGEINASMTQDDGTVATMRSGKNVTVELPDGFSIYPGATVTSNTKVSSSDGGGSVVMFTTDDPAPDLIDFYRKQAEAAGVKIEMQMDTDGMSMIGGKMPDGDSFAFTATGGGDRTNGQLMIGR